MSTKHVPPWTAHFDGNQVPSVTGVEGTLGTADTGGTARPLPIGADPSTGALYVYNLGPAGTTTPSGTQDVNVLSGTLGSILGIGGTVQVSGAAAGTYVNIVTGSSVGTILGGTLQNLVSGTINLGTTVGANAAAGTSTTNPIQIGGTTATGTVYGILVDTAGNPQVDVVTIPQVSVGTLSDLPGGTVDLVSALTSVGAGTLNTLGTVGAVNSIVAGTQNTLGTVGTVPGVGTITNIGSISNIGTMPQFAEDTQHTTGDRGNMVLAVRNDTAAPLAGSTLDYIPFTTGSLGDLWVSLATKLDSTNDSITAVLNTGTITTGSLANVAMLHAGTVNASLVSSTGTIPLITTVSNLTMGSVRMTVGTLTTGTLQNLVSGTVNALAAGTITTGTVSVTVGTVLGPNASGGTSTTAPIQIGGTSATGTVYGMLIDTAGNPQVDVITIPQVSVGTLPTINVTTGTITTGSLANIGVVHNAGSVAALPDLPGGTVDLVTAVTTVSNVTNGSINILTGTIQSSGTTTGVGVVSGLTTGTITTIAAGTQNTLGTVGVVSNLTNGSVNLLTGTVTSVTNLAGGTVQVNPVPVPTILAHGTLGTAGGSFFATISAASGAGTKHYVSGIDIVMQSGTADVRVLAGSAIQGTGVLAGGQFPAGGGIAKNFVPAFATGTNSELIYHFVGAGTAFITVDYWKGA